jgi:hypothetical protein
MKTKSWTEYLNGPEVEAIYEIDLDTGELVGARIVGYYIDEFEKRHEFVRWDDSHGQFHKHCLYEKKQKREDINRPLETAFNEAKYELRLEWKNYKKAFMRNHVQND